jgi:alpha-N-arabinofuranosidase
MCPSPKDMRRTKQAVFLGALVVIATSAGGVVIQVQADKPGARINPAMWGIFFEDINFGADGGLYAELVKNRSFEFPDPLMGWSKIRPSLARGQVSIRDDHPFNAANPHYVHIESQGQAPLGLANEGFRGIGVRKGEAYNFSAQIRKNDGAGSVRIELFGADGTLLDSVRLENFSPDWTRYTAVLRPNNTDARCKLYVLVDGKGSFDFDMVSLFPEKTWKNRPGGLRADMVQALADLKPGFMRFPGGCIVEGSELAVRYQWKKTIGPVAERPLLINRWNYEFVHRPAPDYYQSFGLGFFEFFQLCEDIGAQPLPILNCGMACQFNSAELCPTDQLAPYIQDALDLVEFANGPATSEWGARRAALGHPEPFHLKMMGIGNEQWGPQYVERFAAFSKKLKEKHPELKLIAAAGPDPGDDRFKFLWSQFRALKADIIDEHCYAQPAWFLANTHRYDPYDRNGPKVFMGEYAAQSDHTLSTKNRNNLTTAVAEAAYLTGLERNADVVRMASYAPLFAHVDAWQWTPDLIWVNNLTVLPTANYYVQQLFSRNRGDVVLPTVVKREANPSDSTEGEKLLASATRENSSGEIILKVVNAADSATEAQIDIETATTVAGSATMIVLTGASGDAMNSFEQPRNVVPVESTIQNASKSFHQSFPANSVSVVRLKH